MTEIFVLCSNGWDPGTTEIWGYATTEDKAKEWVQKAKFQDDRWNGCDFDEEIKIDHEKELAKIGICEEDGKFNDSYSGYPFYKTLKEYGDKK